MMNKLALTLIALMVVSAGANASAADNKITAAAKAVGKGIMWAPKKLYSGAKAVAVGTKNKLTGK